MSTTIDIKYIPIIWEKKSTMMLELLELEIHIKNFDIVRRRPLVEVKVMIPTTMKEICWDQTVTSTSSPNQFTRMSKVFVTGSTFPTRSNTMFTVEMKIFQMQ